MGDVRTIRDVSPLPAGKRRCSEWELLLSLLSEEFRGVARHWLTVSLRIWEVMTVVLCYYWYMPAVKAASSLHGERLETQEQSRWLFRPSSSLPLRPPLCLPNIPSTFLLSPSFHISSQPSRPTPPHSSSLLLNNSLPCNTATLYRIECGHQPNFTGYTVRK